MQLAVDGGELLSDLAHRWAVALQPCIVRHPSGAVVRLTLTDGAVPVLRIELDEHRDSRDPARIMRRFIYSNVSLTYFPGARLAREWLAAAWSGAMQHEALELVTVGNLVDRPLDPHAEPFAFDRGLRDGLPVHLTPETLERALCVVMAPEAARALMEAA
jgi:hypothetical protein